MDSTEWKARKRELTAKMDGVIKEYIALTAEYNDQTNPYPVGWVAYAEFVTTESVREENNSSISVHMAAEDQPLTMSRGMHMFGADQYSFPRVRKTQG